MKEFDFDISFFKKDMYPNAEKLKIELLLRIEEEFYDGKRDNGYGGFKYDGRWQKIAHRIFKHYKLKNLEFYKLVQIKVFC